MERGKEYKRGDKKEIGEDMWLAPREIKDNGLETSNKAFVFYLPFIFSYFLLYPFHKQAE